MGVAIDDLRKLIVEAAPDPAQAGPALECDEDALLDGVIPFSSLIVLGVVVAVEDAYGIRVTKQMLQAALAGGATLRKLASMIDAARGTGTP
jgi:acyl carrier protein